MTDTTKQVIAGMGGAVTLAGASLVGAPLWLAVAAGLAILGGVQLVFPSRRPPNEIIYDEGVTEEDLQQALGGIEERLQLFRQIASKVKPDFQAAIGELCEVIQEIADHFRKDPKDIRHPEVASLQPILDMLRNSLQGYLQLAQRETITREEEQTLDRIEKVVHLTIPGLRRLVSVLTNEQRRAMDAEAMTLEALLAGAANEFKESEVANVRHRVADDSSQTQSNPRKGLKTN
ncbi:MAG TPA: hypothetical protein VMW38_05165 [Terriglobia bacterium]|nr:hypothetical protein [Terriglobia bacterium]